MNNSLTLLIQLTCCTYYIINSIVYMTHGVSVCLFIMNYEIIGENVEHVEFSYN